MSSPLSLPAHNGQPILKTCTAGHTLPMEASILSCVLKIIQWDSYQLHFRRKFKVFVCTWPTDLRRQLIWQDHSSKAYDQPSNRFSPWDWKGLCSRNSDKLLYWLITSRQKEHHLNRAESGLKRQWKPLVETEKDQNYIKQKNLNL